MKKGIERKSRMTPQALKELERRHKAGEDMRGLFSLKTGRPIKQSRYLAAVNEELGVLLKQMS